MIKKILIAVVMMGVLTIVLLTQSFKKEPKVLHSFGCDWVVPKKFEQVNHGIYVKDDVVKGTSTINYYKSDDPDSEGLKQFEYSDEYKASFNRIKSGNDFVINNLFLFREATGFIHNAIVITKAGDGNVFFLGQLNVEDAVTFTQNCIEEPVIREIFDRYAVWLEENQFKK